MPRAWMSWLRSHDSEHILIPGFPEGTVAIKPFKILIFVEIRKA